MRGRKRVWVYPAIDHHFLRRELLEDVFAGARHEFVPYVPALDSGAEVFDLEPGQWIAWPQNSMPLPAGPWTTWSTAPSTMRWANMP